MNSSSLNDFTPHDLTTDVSSSEDDLSYDIATTTHIIFNCGINFIVGLIGIVSNILNILVLSHYGMDDSTNVVLLALSVSDLTFSCTESFFRLVCITLELDFSLAYNLSAIYIVFVCHISACTMTVSVWLVAVISAERMVAVCFPFQASRIITSKRIKSTVVFVYVYMIIFYSPCLGIYYMKVAFDPRYNITVLRIFIREGYIDYAWFTRVYGSIVLPACAGVCPIVIILVCTFTTIARLISSTKKLRNLSTASTKRVKEMRSVKISLIICCCMAFSTLIPNACIDGYDSISGKSIPPNTIVFLRCFTQLAVQFNASMNFFIYVALSSKFTKTYIKLFGFE